MVRIVHISDLHFPTTLSMVSLRGKAIIGYLNYSLRRKSCHPRLIWEALVRSLKSLNYDGLVISGDITNVSHHKEFETAKERLLPLLDERCFLIPGNHDRYILKAIHPTPLFESSFGNWMGKDLLTNQPNPPHHKPHSSPDYLRFASFGGLGLLGVDTNSPRPVLEASGEANLNLVQKGMDYLKDQNISSYFFVAHHPLWNPPQHRESKNHQMVNRSELTKVLNQKPPLAYLHGHSHNNWIKKKGIQIPFAVVNSASSTRTTDSTHQSGFHCLDWDGKELMISRYSFNPTLREFQISPKIEFEETTEN